MTAVLAVPGGPALTLTATSLDLLVNQSRQVAFRVAGGVVALTGVPGVTASGTGWTVTSNSTGASVTLGATPVAAGGLVATGGATTLALAGQSLTAATLTVQRSGGTLTLAATGLGLTLAAGGEHVLVVSAGTGTLVVDALGVAGTLTATRPPAGAGFTSRVPGGAVGVVAVNTRSTAALGLPAGPFVRVVATGVTLTVGTGQTLAGSVSFERQIGTGGTPVIVLGLSGITATAADSQLLTAGSGLLVLQGTKVAAVVSGQAGSGAGSGFSGTSCCGSTPRRARSSSRSSSTARPSSSRSRTPRPACSPSPSPAPSSTSPGSSPSRATSRSPPSGSRLVFGGRGLSLFVGVGPAWLADGSLNPLARGLLVTGAAVGLVREGSGPYTYALSASGTVAPRRRRRHRALRHPGRPPQPARAGVLPGHRRSRRTRHRRRVRRR